MRIAPPAKLFALALIFSLPLMAQQARAQLQVDITKGNVDPLPVAIADFRGQARTQGEQIRATQLGAQIVGVISANLTRSGLFRMIEPAAFIERDPDPDGQPRFADWRAINAQGLVVGKISFARDGRVEVIFRLWDVFAGAQMEGKRYVTTPDNWRRIAHKISDDIYQRLTGENGYFDTRIVYVSETGTALDRKRRLAIMDQDGANLRYLTDGSYMVLTPRFSPTSQEITYMSYYNARPRVYLLNIDTGKQEVLGDFDGMTFAPRFSPDGEGVVMTLERGGNSEIYIMDLRTRRSVQLTDNPAIDTSPSFSPDGRQIVFNSDRGGSQQLYVMNRDGSNVRRISFGDGRYGTPVWSPRGDLIAFTRIYKDRFYIGVMRPDGSGERLLTESFLDEGPTWSPNGRVIKFFRQTPRDRSGRGGTTRVWSIDLTGYNERMINTPTDASDPAWSPLID